MLFLLYRFVFYAVLVWSSILLLCTPAQASYTVSFQLNDQGRKFVITPHAKILPDPNAEYTPAQILSDTLLHKEFTSDTLIKNSVKCYWAWVEVESCSQCPANWHMWVYPMASFKVYRVIDQEAVLVAMNGVYVQNSESSFPENPMVARLSITPGASVSYLIRLDSSIPYEFKPRISIEIRPERSEMNSYIQGWILLSVIVGIMIALGFYVLYQYFLFRDRSFLFFFLAFISFALYFLTYDRVGYAIFGTDYITRFTSNYVALFCSFFYFLFSRYFLSTREYYPKIDRYLRLILVLYIIPLVLIIVINLGYFWNFSTYVHLFHVFAFLALIIVAIKSFIDRNPQSGYYLLVNSLFFICLCLYIYYLYHRPAIEHTAPFLLRSSLKIGSMGQVVLFALAMAHRFKKLNLQVVEKQLENERLERKRIMEIQALISSKNTELEERVLERTHEINSQKEELQSQSEHLEIASRESLDQKKLIEKAHSQITDSLYYAAVIQQAVLPKPSLLSIHFSEHFYLYKPRDIVSGDFYWLAETNELTLFAVADCTGHGVPGAFMSMLGISLLNEIVKREGITRTDQILNILRVHLINALQQESDGSELRDGINIALCSLSQSDDDKAAGIYTLEYTGALNPLYIATQRTDNDFEDATLLLSTDDCSIFKLKPDRMPISTHIKIEPFSRYSVKLHKGDMLYLFTDGVVDQLGGVRGRKFSSKRLRELLAKCYPLNPDEQSRAIDECIVDWMNHLDPRSGEPHDQIDDICIMGIRIT